LTILYLTELGNFATIAARVLANILICYTNEESIPSDTETEPWELIYFKLYQSEMPVIEKAVEAAALMLGSDRSRGYCLEMICADFLVEANLDNRDPETLLFSMTRFFKFISGHQRQMFPGGFCENAS
jgi:hypothetical protein